MVDVSERTSETIRPSEPELETRSKSELVHWFLSAPLFIKVLVANSVIVGVGAFIGTWLTEAITDVNRFQLELAICFTLVGVILSAAVNYAVLRTAFRPLIILQKTASTVRAGNLAARVEPSYLSDPQMEELADTFNTMLDTLQVSNSQLRRVAAQVIGAQEEERKRIARELHDQTAQALTTLLVRLKLLEKADSNEKLRAGLAEMRALVSATMDDVRELSRSLRPTLLDDLGLVPALEGYMNNLRERTSEEIVFKVRGFERVVRLPNLVELVCYRVVQEAVTNALKYAGAHTLKIELIRTPGQLYARIEDDGQGFNIEADSGGLGLLGMRERAQLVGGKVIINSGAAQGTIVELRIPLNLQLTSKTEG